MGVLNDSTAALEKGRQFAQHQVAITLIQFILNNPQVNEFHWLDLACGRGQILAHLNQNLHSGILKKITYYGYDIKQTHLDDAQKLIDENKIGFNNIIFKLGDIDNFDAQYPSEPSFDLISITNSFHEILPVHFPKIVVESLLRLKNNGMLFVYDMERLDPNELGAITWSNVEIDKIFNALFLGLGANYNSNSGRWPHSKTAAWNLLVRRDYLSISNDDILTKKESAIDASRNFIKEAISWKLNEAKEFLETMTTGDIETNAEKNDKEKNLYDFWNLSRVKEAF